MHKLALETTAFILFFLTSRQNLLILECLLIHLAPIVPMVDENVDS